MEMGKNDRRWEQGPRVVAIGGGHGLSTLLRGLKLHTRNLTAIVTVADDGDSEERRVGKECRSRWSPYH